MQALMTLPVAFSVRNDHEFFPIQHLMARINPKLMVVQVATGRHINGGCTVFWGLVYLDGERMTQQDIEVALRKAGYDFQHNKEIPTLTDVSELSMQLHV